MGTLLDKTFQKSRITVKLSSVGVLLSIKVRENHAKRLKDFRITNSRRKLPTVYSYLKGAKIKIMHPLAFSLAKTGKIE